jgi:hypothetical protein
MGRARNRRWPPGPPPCDFRFLLSQFQLFRTPARALAAETLNLERTLSDLVNQAYALTPAEIELMWKTAPPRMPIPPPQRREQDKRMIRALHCHHP